MRPTDRLFRLVQLIRGRRLSTAAFLAERLEVSVRTVYRYITQLQAQGVPIEGEAGVGYRMGKEFALPPLMFNQEEARALVASVRLAQPWLDAELALAAEAALSKVMAILPRAERAAAEDVRMFAPNLELSAKDRAALLVLREATQRRHKLELHYRDSMDKTSVRIVRPLGCFFWGKVWTLGAWCEVRNDFRSFRLDRMHKVKATEISFRAEPGLGLSDFLKRAGAGKLSWNS
jgi:predicted DNA-binding transcriptional regulator YafY